MEDAVTENARAYIIGCALGDGNLSNPNGRVTRLRITCNKSYPEIAKAIVSALKVLFPANKVSIVNRYNEECFDISVYSKRLDELMPWKVGAGSKIAQGARVPRWILGNKVLMQQCLRGLIQTDGCMYTDRGYVMVNFVNHNKSLAEDVRDMLTCLGFQPRFNTLTLPYGATRYTVKVARKEQVRRLIDELKLCKA